MLECLHLKLPNKSCGKLTNMILMVMMYLAIYILVAKFPEVDVDIDVEDKENIEKHAGNINEPKIRNNNNTLSNYNKILLNID